MMETQSENQSGDQPLFVFALAEDAVPLNEVSQALLAAENPVSISVDIAGAATEEQLNATDWETAFVRWTTPELHDVYLIERDLVGTDETADQVQAAALRVAAGQPESAGRLIVMDHLRRTRSVYGIQVLPALLADDDHPAWVALDIALRTLATQSEGIILAVGEGFYDEDGEPLLVQDDASEYRTDDDNNTV